MKNMKEMKGKSKRKQHGFQKGSTSWKLRAPSSDGNPAPSPSPFAPPRSMATSECPIKRLNDDEYYNVVSEGPSGTLQLNDEYGRDTGCRVLRPRNSGLSFLDKYSQGADVKEGTDNTYMLLHRGKTAQLWNEAFLNHKELSPTCKGVLDWDDRNSEKRGICWSIGLKCTLCSFTTCKHKLYEEVDSGKRGRRYAAPNLGLQVGIQRHGIGPSGITDIISAMNIDPPSVRGLHHSAMDVSNTIVKTNKEDMDNIIDGLKKSNVMRGLPAENPINVEADATYNNRLGSRAGHSLSQGGTQAVYAVCENVTKKKSIINIRTYSKLCRCKKTHTDSCTRNLPEESAIGNEGQYLKDSINELNKKGITVKHLTLDGDSNSNFVAEGIQQGDTGVNISVQRCTRHLTRSTERKLKAAKFSDEMFPGRTKEERQKAQARFSLDVGDRCQAECNFAHKMYGPDLETKRKALSYIPDVIMSCYKGNCSLCNKYSFVCTGMAKTMWKRPYLNTHYEYRNMNSFISPNENDVRTLRECIQHRLSMSAIMKTHLNVSQNKTEAVNRGLSKCCPKHLTFTRTHSSRVNASTHQQNNPPGESLVKMCSAVGAPIARGSNVVKTLATKDKKHKADQIRKASPKYKSQRAARRKIQFAMYDEKKNAACYQKGMADESRAPEKKKSNKSDHLYVSRK